MSQFNWLLERLKSFGDCCAIIYKDSKLTYRQFSILVEQWIIVLNQSGINKGAIVAVCGDYSPKSAALLFALIIRGNIVVPVASYSESNKELFLSIAQTEFCIEINEDESHTVKKMSSQVTYPLLLQLKSNDQTGIVLFSSGSTGASKAMVLNSDKLLAKFIPQRKSYTTLVFLLIDHIGGINTLFYTLTQGGTLVTIQNRDATTICKAIEQHQIQLLPTTPTFLNMLLISGIYENYNLSSLKMITYGTESMPRSTLQTLNDVFPNINFKQTYGLSEVGILPTKSLHANSEWFLLGNDAVKYKIIDNLLYIHSDTAMLGYLNAPNPFSKDGWLNTGDIVETKIIEDKEYLRILGRINDIINVGGEKVYPAEIENILLQIPNIQDALVIGKKNPVTGNIVTAKVKLKKSENENVVYLKIKSFCKDKLEEYKIPVLIEIIDHELHGARFKKARFTNNNHEQYEGEANV